MSADSSSTDAAGTESSSTDAAPNRRLEARRTLRAAPAEILAVLRDPQGHVRIDSSGMLQSAEGEPVSGVGDRFVVHMDREALGDYDLGRYDVTVIITRFEADAAIAWTIDGAIQPPIGHVYGYELRAVDDGTEVLSYHDWNDAHPDWRDSGILPVLDAKALRATLGILERAVEERRRGLAFSTCTYVGADPQRVWQALTTPDQTARYWSHRNESDWTPGSRWTHMSLDDPPRADTGGTVLEADPPRLLVCTWEDPDSPAARPSVVTFSLLGDGGVTRLTVDHHDLPDADSVRQVALGWPAVLAGLKTYVETGAPLAREPWTL